MTGGVYGTDPTRFSSPPAYYSSYVSGATSRLPELELRTDSFSRATTVDAQLDQQRSELEHELNIYDRYARGWDGYDGVEFDRSTLREAKRFARAMIEFLRKSGLVPMKFQPGPASDGSVDIECELGTRSALLTFYPGTERLVYYGRGESLEYEGEEDLADFPLEGWISWLSGEAVVPDQGTVARRDPR